MNPDEGNDLECQLSNGDVACATLTLANLHFQGQLTAQTTSSCAINRLEIELELGEESVGVPSTLFTALVVYGEVVVYGHMSPPLLGEMSARLTPVVNAVGEDSTHRSQIVCHTVMESCISVSQG